ncbi:MAG TPA: AI-2E family transporter [Desulfobacteraceae bacterium]|nr:AI-2E family transporter [Desulfobacteraceae bacterium]
MKRYGSQFFLALFICSLALLLYLIGTYISAIVLAAVIASVFYPVYIQIKSTLKNNETAASILMLICIVTVLFIPSGWFIGALSNEAYEFYNNTRDTMTIKHAQEFLEGDSIWVQRIKRLAALSGIDPSADTFRSMVNEIGKTIGLFLYKQLSSVASNLLSFVLHFFIMLLAVFYLLRDGMRLKEYTIQLLPLPAMQIEKVIKKFHEMGRAILLINGICGVIQGFCGGLGFYFFGLGAPLLWGTVISFMAFLPVIGASVVFIPATAVLMLQGKINIAFAFLAFNLFYSSIIEYLVKPRLIGAGMHMNSLMVFIGIIGGIKLFGIMGILYGPLIITTFITMAEIYRTEY